MPCYLYTWHAYGSWLPDRPQGYVHWSRGRSAANTALAQCYRRQQKEPEVEFSESQQHEIIVEIVESASRIEMRLHFITTETSHVHVLVSWKDERPWERLRRSIRRSISARLNRSHRCRWLSRGGNARQVSSQRHFMYLTNQYLPSHQGWKWSEQQGLFK